MANTSTTLVIGQTDALNLEGRGGKEALGRVIDHLNGYLGGSKRGTSIQLFPDGSAPVRAFQIVDLSTATAGMVIEVNGVPFTALSGTATVANNEWDIAGADGVDATKLAAAINNSTSAAIQYVVGAAAVGADTLTAATAIAGNSFTVVLADGTKHKFTGVEGEATLGQANFSVDTGDTETATSIAAQINGYAPFSGKVTATSSSAVVLLSSADGQTFTLTGTASTLAESDTGKVIIRAVQAGAIGNALTVKTLGVVATSTNTLVTPSGAQTVVLNGVTVHNATALGTATLEAAAQAASINASTNALISGHVRALSRAGVLHVFAVYPGTIGNQITFSVTGTGATAAHARLQAATEASSGGAQASGTIVVAGPDGGTYTATINGVGTGNLSGTNGDATATALTIATAIQTLCNTNAALAGIVTCTVSAGTVTITACRGGISGNVITLAATGTGATASGARLTGGAAPTTIAPATPRMTGGAGGNATLTTITL